MLPTAGSKPVSGEAAMDRPLAEFRDQVWSRLMITHLPHLRLHLRKLLDGIDAERFACLQDGEGFDPLSFAAENSRAIGEVELPLAIVVLEQAQSVQQFGPGKDIRAHVDFGDFALLIGRVFFFYDAQKIAAV